MNKILKMALVALTLTLFAAPVAAQPDLPLPPNYVPPPAAPPPPPKATAKPQTRQPTGTRTQTRTREKKKKLDIDCEALGLELIEDEDEPRCQTVQEAFEEMQDEAEKKGENEDSLIGAVGLMFLFIIVLFLLFFLRKGKGTEELEGKVGKLEGKVKELDATLDAINKALG